MFRNEGRLTSISNIDFLFHIKQADIYRGKTRLKSCRAKNARRAGMEEIFIDRTKQFALLYACPILVEIKSREIVKSLAALTTGLKPQDNKRHGGAFKDGILWRPVRETLRSDCCWIMREPISMAFPGSQEAESTAKNTRLVSELQMRAFVLWKLMKKTRLILINECAKTDFLKRTREDGRAKSLKIWEFKRYLQIREKGIKRRNEFPC